MKIAAIITLIIIFGIGIIAYLIKTAPLPGVHLKVYGGIPTAESWVFEAPLLPSYRDYYCRAWGFQDTTYFVAVSGSKVEIDKLIAILTDKLVVENSDIIRSIADIEIGLHEADSDNRIHGWNVREARNIKWWSGYKGNVVVVLDQDRNRVYYRSYTE
jgi:hypothetical protein